MRSNSFPVVLAPFRRSLCLFWRETHTKDWEWDLPRDRKWRREGRSQRRQRSSWQRWAEEDRRLEVAVQRGRLAEGGSEKKESTEVSTPIGFIEVSRKIHARDSLQMHGELHESVTQTSPFLRLELTHVRASSFVFLLSPSWLCFAYL